MTKIVSKMNYDKYLIKRIRKLLKEQVETIEALSKENKALREENIRINEWGKEGIDWEWCDENPEPAIDVDVEVVSQ